MPSTTPTAASAAAAASSTDVVGLKQQLRQSIEGLDRGIFGVQVRGACEQACAICHAGAHTHHHETYGCCLLAWVVGFLQAAKRQEVAEIVSALEALNPTTNPTQHLDMVQGAWNLLYTTITITVSTGSETEDVVAGKPWVICRLQQAHCQGAGIRKKHQGCT